MGCSLAGSSGRALSPGSILPTPAPGDDPAPRNAFDDYLRRWEAFGFSGAVLIERDGAVLLQQGYGLANRAAGHVVTTETLFDLGSLSKQFTAAAILELVERGRLRLEDSLGSLLAAPDAKASITVHQLLTHTSGIGDPFREDEILSRDEVVTRAFATELDSPPGAEYAYSNVGYTLLAAIVEVASGESFESFLRRQLLTPAGMAATGFVWEAKDRWPDDQVALGYGGFQDPCGGEDPRQRTTSWVARGNGGVLSTLADLYRWELALRGERILSAASRELLFRPHVRAEAEFLSYGYGWRVQETDRGTRVVWHSGLDGAFSTVYRRYLEERTTLIFLSNLSFDGVPARDLLATPAREGPLGALLFGGEFPAVPDLGHAGQSPNGWNETYTLPTGGRWIVESGRGSGVLRAEGQDAVDALFPPDAEQSARNAAANDRAAATARGLAAGDAAEAERVAGELDPLGYAGRSVAEVAAEWRRHGKAPAVSVLGSTWVRRGPRERTTTYLRLAAMGVTWDEHFLWFDTEEPYVLRCAPDSFQVRLVPVAAREAVGFDLVSGRAWRFRFPSDKEPVGSVELTVLLDGAA